MRRGGARKGTRTLTLTLTLTPSGRRANARVLVRDVVRRRRAREHEDSGNAPGAGRARRRGRARPRARWTMPPSAPARVLGQLEKATTRARHGLLASRTRAVHRTVHLENPTSPGDEFQNTARRALHKRIFVSICKTTRASPPPASRLATRFRSLSSLRFKRVSPRAKVRPSLRSRASFFIADYTSTTRSPSSSFFSISRSRTPRFLLGWRRGASP